MLRRCPCLLSQRAAHLQRIRRGQPGSHRLAVLVAAAQVVGEEAGQGSGAPQLILRL